MDKLKTPATAMPFIEALRDLIRTGAAASPTLESSCLVDLPIVWQRGGKHASKAKRAYTFIKILQQIITQRLEGKDAQTANILFGFDIYAGMPIQDRYRAAAKLHNKYWTWENYRKEPLTRHLLAVYLALEREAELTPLPPHFGERPKQARSGLVGQDWVLEHFESTYNFPTKPGEQFEVLQTRRLRATADGVNVYRHWTRWRERGIPGVPTHCLFGPGTISVIDSHFDKTTGIWTYITEIAFPEPLRYGESIEFTVLKRAQVEFDRIICDTGHDRYGTTPASPADYATIGLRFSPDKQPRTVWRYEDILSGLTRNGTPTKQNILTVDSTGFVGASWSDLTAGYSYGIALEW